jgi:hypothetical protein
MMPLPIILIDTACTFQALACFSCVSSFLAIINPNTARPTNPIRTKAEPRVISAFIAGLLSAVWLTADEIEKVKRVVGFIKIPIPKKSNTTRTMKAIIVLFTFNKSYFSVLYVCYCNL